jgi:peroxiredoxin
MPFRVAGFAVLGLCLAVAAQGGSAPAEAAYRALEKEYNDALVDYQKALREADTPQEKQQVMRDRHPPVGKFAARFLALARKYSDSPAAVDALFWVATHPTAPDDRAGLRAEAMTLLAREHIRSDKVGLLCTMLVFSVDPATEAFLRDVLERSRRSPIRARACASLAVNLKHRARLVPALKNSLVAPDVLAGQRNSAAVVQYEQAFGKKAIRQLLASDPVKLRAESEKLFERVIDKYGEIPHPTHGTLEKYARRHLLAMRKPVDEDRVAPPISGEDVAGKKLRLSDFKGNVVLLDFWANAFPPCRAMYDYERGLVKRLEGKPFVLLGVNGDSDRKTLRKTMAKKKITWPSFWDGDFFGPIATRWDVDARPALFLIDHKGVIRHFFAGWPDTRKLDRLIDELVRKARKSP